MPGVLVMAAVSVSASSKREHSALRVPGNICHRSTDFGMAERARFFDRELVVRDKCQTPTIGGDGWFGGIPCSRGNCV